MIRSVFVLLVFYSPFKYEQILFLVVFVFYSPFEYDHIIFGCVYVLLTF